MMGVQESKQEVKKLTLLLEMAENLPRVSSHLAAL